MYRQRSVKQCLSMTFHFLQYWPQVSANKLHTWERPFKLAQFLKKADMNFNPPACTQAETYDGTIVLHS